MIAIDTNILIYAEGLGDTRRCEAADALLRKAQGVEIVLPVQVLAEAFRVLVKKARLGRTDARRRLERYVNVSRLAPTLSSTFSDAVDLATDHGLQVFDAIILAASAEAGCRLLLSEDMQDGFVWRGVTVANPFAPTPHPMLADLLRG